MKNPAFDNISRPRIGITTWHEYQPDNKLTLRKEYISAVYEAGGLPFLLPTLPPEEVSEYISFLDGLLLTGGEDINPLLYDEFPHRALGQVDSARDHFELALTKAWLQTQKPLLGICRGQQTLHVASGGTLIQDIPSEVPHSLKHRQLAPKGDPCHLVEIAPDSLLSRWLETSGMIQVNSIHHQAVLTPTQDFTVSATASDGIIEAIEAINGSPVLGVQWHPEHMQTACQKALFRNFIQSCLSTNY